MTGSRSGSAGTDESHHWQAAAIFYKFVGLRMNIRQFVRQKIPYGVWKTKEGNRVLFNRSYDPMWIKYEGRDEVVRADPNLWVQNIVSEQHFYDDSYSDAERLQAWESMKSKWWTR